MQSFIKWLEKRSLSEGVFSNLFGAKKMKTVGDDHANRYAAIDKQSDEIIAQMRRREKEEDEKQMAKMADDDKKADADWAKYGAKGKPNETPLERRLRLKRMGVEESPPLKIDGDRPFGYNAYPGF